LTFLRSRDGSLWIGGFNGLSHLHQGRIDVFGREDGLSGQVVNRLYEDREGNIWVGTSSGLDRFREFTFPTLSPDQGLSSSLTWAVQASRDGSVWIAASNGLNRWQDGRVTFYGTRPPSPAGRRSEGVRTVPLLESAVRSMALDDQDRLWVGLRQGIFRIEGERLVQIPGLPGWQVLAIATAGHDEIWVSVEEGGLFHWTARDPVQNFSWAFFGGKDSGSAALLPDPARHGVWIGFRNGGVARLEDGRVAGRWGTAEGLGAGHVNHLRSGERGAVWAATEGGLSRIADGKVRTLTTRQGLPCDAVSWSMEDDDHSVWLYTRCGLVRLARSDLDEWVKDPARTIHPTLFDVSDGVMKVGTYSGYFGPSVAKGPDGKIWFAHDDGVTRIDPRHLPSNPLPPPVHVEQITADGKGHDAAAGPLRLTPHVRDLSIDYTALSLVAPEKVRFRVKLEGQDKDWRELVNERHVRYTNLPPSSYRFRVSASNESGVWTDQDASLDLVIPPAWYQAGWFRALCVLALGSLLWAAHRVRLGILVRQQRLLEGHQREITALNEQLMKAQEEERTRIAGELHDGVLQQLTSAALNLGTVKYQAPRDSPIKAEIAAVQGELEQIGTDIRQISHELHPAALSEAGLPKALANYCAEFSATRGIMVTCAADDVDQLSHGTALALYRIAQEALGNVAKHAKARAARVRLERAGDEVRLTVSDDGLGFVRGGNGAGVGLVNMRERVRQLGGKFQLESEPGRGTTIRAEVPFRRATTA
jgi:signal transduction histidine kinase